MILSNPNLTQIRQKIALDLGFAENEEFSLITHKGSEIIDEKDLIRLSNNTMVFVTGKSKDVINFTYLDENFISSNYMVPYEIIRPLGEVYIFLIK